MINGGELEAADHPAVKMGRRRASGIPTHSLSQVNACSSVNTETINTLTLYILGIFLL